jgi:tRNA dimethylallyltransferase
VGKTAAAISVAQALDTAIISADSRQCYHEMNIGVARPSAAELAAAPHYFIDAFPVTQALSAADFESLALQYLDSIFKKRNIAVVCGGTGLYIKALCEGLDQMPPADPQITETVNASYEQNGLNWLQDAVQQEDPDFYAQGETENPARLIRALIFKRSTGESILAYRTRQVKERPFRIVKAGLELPRPVLYERIDRRVHQMMRDGLLDEARALYPLRALKNLQTVGYTELFDYMDGVTDLDRAVELIQQHSRNYAKRQLTWFKKDPDMHWFDAAAPDICNRLLTI